MEEAVAEAVVGEEVEGAATMEVVVEDMVVDVVAVEEAAAAAVVDQVIGLVVIVETAILHGGPNAKDVKHQNLKVLVVILMVVAEVAAAAVVVVAAGMEGVGTAAAEVAVEVS